MSYDLDIDYVRSIVKAALQEDGAFRDVTTLALVPPEQKGRGVFLAKEPGVVAGVPVAEAAFTAIDPSVRMRALRQDGEFVEAGGIIAEVEGSLASILSAERVALNFMQRLGGTATLTRALVDVVAGTKARVVDTRKTTPGLRALERYAVRVGGGGNHRYNLADGVLIKDNHLAAAASRGLTMRDVLAAARAGVPHTMRIEVEVESFEQCREAVEGGADVILLDNMTPAEMQRCVTMIAGRALTEASGGITLQNARAIAESGVDIMSSGALTHSAKALDISLDVETVVSQRA